MKVRQWFMSIVILAAVATAYLPLYAAEKIITVQKVDSEADGKNTLINLTFDSAFKGKTPELEGHGSFLQLALPDALTPNPGQFYDVKSPVIQKMAVFQTGPKTVAFRLFVKQNADEIKKAATVDLLGERLMISFDHAKLAGLGLDKESIESAKLGSEAAKEISADEVVANTEVRNDIADPVSAITGKAADKAAVLGKEDFNLQKKLIPVAIFSAIMLSGLFLMHMARRLMRRSKQGPAPQAFVMKTIASYNLAPKHKLALVQVGGQQVLLGVGPEGINFLTSMNTAPVAPQPSYVMAPQAPMMALDETQAIASERTQNLRKKLLAEKASKEAEAPVARAKKTSTFSVAVDDDGIKPVPNEESVGGGQKSIEDVTNLIRRKLKNLPNI